MKNRLSSLPALVGLVVGVLAAGGLVWAAAGGGDDQAAQWCRTKAGYLRMSTTGECRRAEVPVSLPQGPQGEQGLQGEPGADGRDGSDASIESVRCNQRFTARVDLHGCTLGRLDFAPYTDLSGADLRSAKVAQSPLTLVPTLSTARGYSHCSLSDLRSPVCWGSNSPFQGAPDLTSTPFLSLGIGVWHSCGLRTDRQLLCWGTNNYGQLSRTEVDDVRAYAVGDIHTCVLLASGSVECWGNNYYGQVDVPDRLGSVVQIVAGGYFACALREDGTPVCWGYDNGGPGSLAPPPALPPLKKLFATYRNPCGVDDDDHLYCWGYNSFGLLNFPAGVDRVKSVDGGDGHMCVVDLDDTMQCWGVGRVDTLPSGTKVRQLVTGFWDACGVLMSGEVKCWAGSNTYGQLSVPPAAAGEIERSVILLHGAAVDDADLSALDNAVLKGCDVTGTATRLPQGWTLDHGCFVPRS